MIVPHVPNVFRTLRQIVRLEETREGRVYHVYSLPARADRCDQGCSANMAGASAPRHFETIADNEIGFFDAGGRPLHPRPHIPKLRGSPLRVATSTNALSSWPKDAVALIHLARRSRNIILASSPERSVAQVVRVDREKRPIE